MNYLTIENDTIGMRAERVHRDITSNNGQFVLERLYGVTDSLGYLCNEHAFCANGETRPVYKSGHADEPCDDCGRILNEI